MLGNLVTDFGADIQTHVAGLERLEDQTDFLGKHGITADYRAKMVDWMVEVLTTFKCTDQTFFLAVALMDRYFKKTESKLTSSDLHITGITAMFVASKYEDIIPLLMKTVVQKIGHGKFQQRTFEDKEIDILQALEFRVGAPTSLEHLDRYLLENGLKSKKLHTICTYLCKMASHSYELSQVKPAVLAACALFVGLRIYERVDATVPTEKVLKSVVSFAGLDGAEVKTYSKELLAFAKGFETKYPRLQNLRNQYNDEFCSLKI